MLSIFRFWSRNILKRIWKNINWSFVENSHLVCLLMIWCVLITWEDRNTRVTNALRLPNKSFFKRTGICFFSETYDAETSFAFWKFWIPISKIFSKWTLRNFYMVTKRDNFIFFSKLSIRTSLKYVQFITNQICQKIHL